VMEEQKNTNNRRIPLKGLLPLPVDQPDLACSFGSGGDVRMRAQLVSSPRTRNLSGGSGGGAIKLRILEQENERLVKKIKGLEEQLRVKKCQL